ncbi:MAG: outer membrane beta-barrel protein [Candidatus Cyclobacteriaceae bacterium M2_1C_046]
MKTQTASFFIFVVLIAAFSENVTAQIHINGRVKDASGNSIPYANVVLLTMADSSVVNWSVTDIEGIFNLDNVKSGNYLLKTLRIGYEETYTELEITNSSSVSPLTIIIPEKSQQLDEVVVKAEKPLFEQKLDRTIVNVASSISASGGSALDVLSRSPGVTVDRMNNSLALAGKQGVRIMINGKISQIPLSAVIQMLDGMNAENIEKIELITTPPAKYEAEGDGGLINIVLKQHTELGTNGNLSVSGGYGRKEKYGGTINFNNRSKKVNLYGDYSYNMDVTEQLFIVGRTIELAGNQISIDTENNRDAYTRVHSGRLGADWNIGKNTTVRGLVSIFDRRWEMDALADIKEVVNNNLSGYIEMETFEINEWTLVVGNINLTHTFSENHSLSMDLDHIDYDSDNPTNYDQLFFDADRNQINYNELSSRKETPINSWVGKVDYTGNRGKKVIFEAGAKGSFSSLNNDIVVEDIENGSAVINESLTSHAKMVENIGAGYVSASIDASEKIALKLGLRYEYTSTNIDTHEFENIVDRNFGSWFPSFFFQNTINKNNSWVFSYSRRITRPSFAQIAPFVIFIDPNSFWSGNIGLLPSLTDAVKAEYQHKFILLSLQYSHDKNSIARFQPRILEDGTQVSTAENMDYRNNYSISLSLPFNPTEWWEWQLNMSGNIINVKTDYLEQPVDITIKNFTLNCTQKFTLPKQFTAEIAGFYQSKQLWGVMEMKALGGVDFGLEKKFKNSQLRLAITDIFNTNKWNFSTSIPEENLNSYSSFDFETRVISVTYSVGFGNKKLKVKNRKTTGSEEEQRRLN